MPTKGPLADLRVVEMASFLPVDVLTLTEALDGFRDARP